MQNTEKTLQLCFILSHLIVSAGTGLVKPLPWDLKILLLQLSFSSCVALQS